VRTFVVLAAAVLACVLLAGCGDKKPDGTKKGTTGVPKPATRVAANAAAVPVAADHAGRR
jgi:hypothetical protein